MGMGALNERNMHVCSSDAYCWKSLLDPADLSEGVQAYRAFDILCVSLNRLFFFAKSFPAFGVVSAFHLVLSQINLERPFLTASMTG